MIGNAHFDDLVEMASVLGTPNAVDWTGIAEALRVEQVEPSDAVAVSWCSYTTMGTEASAGWPGLLVVHRGGVLVSAGKRKVLNREVKYATIPFSSCRQYGETEFTFDWGAGKYCIEFAGAGGILIGRLEWPWKAKRFRDSRAQVMAVAEERDRILREVSRLLTS